MKKSNLKAMWECAIDEIKDSKKYIFAIFLVFLLSAIYGFVFYNNLGFLDNLLKNILSQVKDVTGAKLTFYILLNNAQSALFSMILGIFFGFVPIFNSLFNGLVIGYVLARVSNLDGIGELWRIIPHGIFELPAIFIALGIGLRLGLSLFDKVERSHLANRVYRAILVFVFVVLPLLMIAAIIESLLISFYK